ncbi:hypothetical protein NW062_02440 [Mycoplasmopsis cynos]|nr:hypothetical protein NW062_02440 [Mycoplasmopsis cynos]
MTRGSFFVKTSKDLIDESRRVSHEIVLYQIKNNPEWTKEELEKILMDRLSSLFYKEKRRNPVIVPTIIFTDEKPDRDIAKYKIKFGLYKNFKWIRISNC